VAQVRRENGETAFDVDARPVPVHSVLTASRWRKCRMRHFRQNAAFRKMPHDVV
jgi:hypothetical protein